MITNKILQSLICAILSLALLFSFVSCGGNAGDTASTSAPLTDPDESAAVMAFLEGSRETPYMD